MIEPPRGRLAAPFALALLSGALALPAAAPASATGVGATDGPVASVSSSSDGTGTARSPRLRPPVASVVAARRGGGKPPKVPKPPKAPKRAH